MTLVSMFRCKQCKVRMFERDCLGHLQRHGVDVKKLSPAEVAERFERGPQDANARPGDGMKPMYYGGKRKPTQADPDEPGDEELN